MHDDEVDVSVELVRQLVDTQFSGWAGFELRVVEPWGTDNAIYRLGDDLVVRLPRIESAVAQIAFEAEWLPRWSKRLPIAVPESLAIGEPDGTYPFPWAIHRWIDGDGADLVPIDVGAFADDLTDVVTALRNLPTAGGRPARNRARPIAEYDLPTRKAIDSAAGLIDVDAATAIWDAALAADPHPDGEVWVHGDLEGNCLTLDGRLHGLIDWGSACVGDPAVDIQVVWSRLFTSTSRSRFLERLGVDDATIARSRGAAINQACAALPYYLHTYPTIVERSIAKLHALGVATTV